MCVWLGSSVQFIRISTNLARFDNNSSSYYFPNISIYGQGSFGIQVNILFTVNVVIGKILPRQQDTRPTSPGTRLRSIGAMTGTLIKASDNILESSNRCFELIKVCLLYNKVALWSDRSMVSGTSKLRPLLIQGSMLSNVVDIHVVCLYVAIVVYSTIPIIASLMCLNAFYVMTDMWNIPDGCIV